MRFVRDGVQDVAGMPPDVISVVTSYLELTQEDWDQINTWNIEIVAKGKELLRLGGEVNQAQKKIRLFYPRWQRHVAKNPLFLLNDVRKEALKASVQLSRATARASRAKRPFQLLARRHRHLIHQRLRRLWWTGVPRRSLWCCFACVPVAHEPLLAVHEDDPECQVLVPSWGMARGHFDPSSCKPLFSCMRCMLPCNNCPHKP